MLEPVAGMWGFLAGLLTFLVGLAVGWASGRAGAGRWIREHGCYLCRERYEYRDAPHDDEE